MNKTVKKIISLVLTMLMLMSFASVAFAEETTASDYVVVEDEVDEHRSLTSIIIEFFVSFYEFLKYIFYDVFRGVAPQ